MTELDKLAFWLNNLCKNVAEIGFAGSGCGVPEGIGSVKAFPGTQKNQMEFESAPLARLGFRCEIPKKPVFYDSPALTMTKPVQLINLVKR